MTGRALRVLIVLLGPVLLSSPPAYGDAGLLRVSEVSGPYRISVFSEPTPLRLDRGMLSILIADHETGRPLRDVEVQVRIASPVDPARAYVKPAKRPGRGLRFTATLDEPGAPQVCPMHPEFEATRPGYCPHCGMELVSRSRPPGLFAIRIEVESNRGEGSVSFEANIEAPESQWVSLGPSLAVPPLGILLFVLHQSLRHRMQARRGKPAGDSRRTSTR